MVVFNSIIVDSNNYARTIVGVPNSGYVRILNIQPAGGLSRVVQVPLLIEFRVVWH